MAILDREKILQDAPYLAQVIDKVLFIDLDEYDSYIKDYKIRLDGKSISIKLLKKLISDTDYFSYLQRLLFLDGLSLNINYFAAGDICGNMHYSRADIVTALYLAKKNNLFEFSNEASARARYLYDLVSFDALINDFKDKVYTIDIDGNSFNIKCQTLMNILQMPYDDFYRLCNDETITQIDGIKKEYILYATKSFFEDSLLGQYLVPSKIKDRYEELSDNQKIDLEAINSFTKSSFNRLSEISINKDLHDEVLKEMPKDLSDLEKAIYIYIKMCKILTYDDEYFAVNQVGEATQKHKDIHYVESINLENNQVVCYEFNLLYISFLHELGIKFKTDMSKKFVEADGYGEGHDNVTFRCGKFIITADSVTSILHGDIMQAKFNQPLIGLTCENESLRTKDEFKSILDKVYNLIAKQEGFLDNNQDEPPYKKVLEEYASLTDNVKTVPLQEKLKILISKVNSTSMVGIDSLSYLLQLRKIIFNQDEQKNNIKIAVIRDNENVSDKKVASAKAIIAINVKGFEEDEDSNVYYYFDPNHELSLISHDDLVSKFANNVFGYIGVNNPEIPGISHDITAEGNNLFKAAKIDEKPVINEGGVFKP